MRLALLFFLFLLSACSHTKQPTKCEAKLYLQADPLSLDPRIGGDRRSQCIIRQLFDGLFHYGEGRTLEPLLASSYTISPDGLVYTFTLKPACWSNGAKVTAHDFVYAWTSVLDPSFPSSFAYAFYPIKNAKAARLGTVPLDKVGVRAMNSDTLEVTLEHPTPYFLELTANPLYSPLYKPFVENDKEWAKKVGKEFITNGPFRLQKRAAKESIILETNPFYLGKDKSKVSTISFTIIDDPMTAFSLILKGELDWLGDPLGTVPLDVLATLEQENRLTKKRSDKECWLMVGTKYPHLESVKIRKAIASACHRHDLCAHILKGNEHPASSILAPDISQTDGMLFFSDGDPEEANRLFCEGLQDLGMTREEYPELVISYLSDPTEKIVVQTLQQQIEDALHIRIRLESYDWPSYFKKIFGEKSIQLGSIGWVSWLFDPISTLEAFSYANSGTNGTSWENARFIELLDKANNTADPVNRRKLLREAEEIIMTELPIIPLYSVPYKYAKNANIEGEKLSPNGILELRNLSKQ